MLFPVLEYFGRLSTENFVRPQATIVRKIPYSGKFISPFQEKHTPAPLETPENYVKENYSFSKPNGIWTSTILNTGSTDWIDWCMIEHMYEWVVNKRAQIFMPRIDISNQPKILVLRNKIDTINLWKAFAVKTSERRPGRKLGKLAIDWSSVSKYFDAVRIAYRDNFIIASDAESTCWFTDPLQFMEDIKIDVTVVPYARENKARIVLKSSEKVIPVEYRSELKTSDILDDIYSDEWFKNKVLVSD